MRIKLRDTPIIGVLEGGTDEGSMVIFGPAGMQEDYDSRACEDPVTLLQRLADDQTLFWLDTSSDGRYTVGVAARISREASRMKLILADLVKELPSADAELFGGLGPVAAAGCQGTLNRPALDLGEQGS